MCISRDMSGEEDPRRYSIANPPILSETSDEDISMTNGYETDNSPISDDPNRRAVYRIKRLYVSRTQKCCICLESAVDLGMNCLFKNELCECKMYVCTECSSKLSRDTCVACKTQLIRQLAHVSDPFFEDLTWEVNCERKHCTEVAEIYDGETARCDSCFFEYLKTMSQYNGKRTVKIANVRQACYNELDRLTKQCEDTRDLWEGEATGPELDRIESNEDAFLRFSANAAWCIGRLRSPSDFELIMMETKRRQSDAVREITRATQKYCEREMKRLHALMTAAAQWGTSTSH